MKCVNCNSLIIDIDSVRFAPEDCFSEYPMCPECAPSHWATEADYWDSMSDDLDWIYDEDIDE